MNRILFLIPVLVFSAGVAYAQPLEDIQTRILEYDGSSATVQIDWSQDDTVTKYEVGCVSCMPNITEFTAKDSIVIKDVTSIPGNQKAMLYIIAYDSDDEIISAQQILVDITG